MDEYAERASMFAQRIVVALDCLEEARAMQKIFVQEKFRTQYQTAPHFYLTAYFAMLFRFQVDVAKLFDNKTGTYSFECFKNELARAGKIKTQDAYEFKHKKDIADDDLTELRKRRNTFFAHTDKKYFNDPQCVFRNHPVSFDNIKQLLQIMLKICNQVIWDSSQHGSPCLYSTYNGDDFVKLFGYTTQSEKETEEFFNLLK